VTIKEKNLIITSLSGIVDYAVIHASKSLYEDKSSILLKVGLDFKFSHIISSALKDSLPAPFYNVPLCFLFC
jgi:hypothetical protein